MLQSETDLPYERLLKLYKEVAGKSPSKGQLPFSTDWFMTWQPNIHASLFYNIHTYLMKSAPIDDSDAIIKAYELYTAEVKSYGVEPMLSLTRAWRLVRFIDTGLVTAMQCRRCKGQFINHPYERKTASYADCANHRPVRARHARRARSTERKERLTPPASHAYEALRHSRFPGWEVRECLFFRRWGTNLQGFSLRESPWQRDSMNALLDQPNLPGHGVVQYDDGIPRDAPCPDKRAHDT